MLEVLQTLKKWEILPVIIVLGSFENYVLSHQYCH